tara:strand:- start:31219 stop:32118 length:900 start_codon:yes stop_codon:yes gene_type:complete
MKILLIGSNGQLGKALIKSKPQGHKLITTNKNNINLENKNSITSFIKKVNPDWIFNCGAYTNVDKAEIEKELAFKINAEGPKTISEVLLETKGKLLQISTDFVFDGQRSSPYPTNHPRSPINSYGLTKSKGEEFIEEILPNKNQAIILRTSWLMGPTGSNFALKMLNLIKTKKEIKVVADQWGCPTSTRTLANACWRIITIKEKELFSKTNVLPILHWCDEGFASWYDVAVEIRDISTELGLIKNPAKLTPINNKSYPSTTKRPNYSLLSCLSTRKLLQLEGENWRITLKKDLESLLEN